MSQVTNVIITTEIEDSGMGKLNERLVTAMLTPLNEVSNYCGGTKAFEADVWLAAYNYLTLDAFIDMVGEVEWESPYGVRVFVKEQEDEHFVDRTPSLKWRS